MPYTDPTPEAFKARFPGFAEVSDTLIDAMLAEAIPQVGEAWVERDRNPAILYLTAHMLVMEGYPASSDGEAIKNLTRGPVSRVKVGDVETQFGNGSSAGGASDGGASLYNSTEYGRRFLEIMRRNFPAVLVV